jgi:type IV pilus assembly protein PilF
MLGVLYEQIGEMASAEKHYQLAVQAAPANGDVNNNFGVFLCKSGRLDAAERHFLKAIEDPFYRTPAVALANAGSCFLQNGNLDKAEKYLRQSLEYDAEFPDALLPMASVSQQKGEHLRARAFLQRYQATGSESAASLALGVRIETSLDNERAAQDYRDRLLRDHPDSPQAADVMSRVRS